MITRRKPRFILRDLRLLAEAWYARQAGERRTIYEKPAGLQRTKRRFAGRSSWSCLQR
jgi:hypothetical protein